MLLYIYIYEYIYIYHLERIDGDSHYHATSWFIMAPYKRNLHLLGVASGQSSILSLLGVDLYVPWSNIAILGMVIQPLIGIVIMGI